jgi:hypothetical protein
MDVIRASIAQRKQLSETLNMLYAIRDNPIVGDYRRDPMKLTPSQAWAICEEYQALLSKLKAACNSDTPYDYQLSLTRVKTECWDRLVREAGGHAEAIKIWDEFSAAQAQP